MLFLKLLYHCFVISINKNVFLGHAKPKADRHKPLNYFCQEIFLPIQRYMTRKHKNKEEVLSLTS